MTKIESKYMIPFEYFGHSVRSGTIIQVEGTKQTFCQFFSLAQFVKEFHW